MWLPLLSGNRFSSKRKVIRKGMQTSVIEIIRRVLADNPKNSVDLASLVPAGVACLLYPKDGDYCVLLNKRSMQVEHHKGEVSFPGGRRDPEDDSMLATALRETHEEMGILPEDIDVLGQLDDVETNTNYLMYTYVGTIPYPYDFNPSSIEVAGVLEVPISALLDENNRRDEIRLINGEPINSPAFAYEGQLIYGATGRVLQNLLDLVGPALDKEAPWTTKTR